jgi:hypothetical protein
MLNCLGYDEGNLSEATNIVGEMVSSLLVHLFCIYALKMVYTL